MANLPNRADRDLVTKELHLDMQDLLLFVGREFVTATVKTNS